MIDEGDILLSEPVGLESLMRQHEHKLERETGQRNAKMSRSIGTTERLPKFRDQPITCTVRVSGTGNRRPHKGLLDIHVAKRVTDYATETT